MKIHLKLVKTTLHRLIFEFPDTFEFKNHTYKKDTTCHLMVSLKKADMKLHELFINKEEFSANWETAKFEKKKIVVEIYSSDEEFKNAKKKRRSDRQASKQYHPCHMCGNICKKGRATAGCCSEACTKENFKLRGIAIAKTHWSKSKERDDINVKIQEKRKLTMSTREYIPWNKGKTGVYSLETIEKIRAATRKQFHEERVKKTKIEIKVDEFIASTLNVKYKYNYFIKGRSFDFGFHELKIVIELQGDFWHGNQKFYGEDKKLLRDHQIMKRKDDFIKKRIAEEDSYEYYEFWEDDINNDWENVKNAIKEILVGT